MEEDDWKQTRSLITNVEEEKERENVSLVYIMCIKKGKMGELREIRSHIQK